MSRTKKVSLGLLVVVLLMVLAGGLVFWQRPLAVTRHFGLRALIHGGFVKQEVATPSGKSMVWEAGTGPTLVLVHGAGDYAGAWALVAPHLTQRYHVLIPDLPGHGESEPAAGPLKFSQVLQGLEAVLEQRGGKEPVTLVGNSLGGWLALVYAQRHPDRVARVVSVCGGGPRLQLKVSLSPANREEARQFMRALLDPGTPVPPDYVLDDLVRTSRTGAAGRLLAETADLEQHYLDGRFQEIRTPVDLLWGASDQLIPVESARRMEAELPAARLTVIPRCGHVPQRECSAAFESELGRLLSGPPPEAKPPAAAPPAAKKPAA
jgi:pimeloyl-ACP methyl ester carboxylesterase